MTLPPRPALAASKAQAECPVCGDKHREVRWSATNPPPEQALCQEPIADGMLCEVVPRPGHWHRWQALAARPGAGSMKKHLHSSSPFTFHFPSISYLHSSSPFTIHFPSISLMPVDDEEYYGTSYFFPNTRVQNGELVYLTFITVRTA